MTKPIASNSAPSSQGTTAATATSYASLDSADLPSFWTAVLRFRHRHGLADPKRQQPLLDDEDLQNLRDQSPPRDFAFDDQALENLTPNS